MCKIGYNLFTKAHLISIGQTTHITIEEEHPGVDDEPVANQKTGEDDDDTTTATVEFDQGLAGIDQLGRTRSETSNS